MAPEAEPAYFVFLLIKNIVQMEFLACRFQILELQQNLAVAVSTDRKKDGVIEQLDKVTPSVDI